MAESLKNKTLKGLAWTGIENFSCQGVQFLVMLVMANLLTPADYGLLSMIGIFTAIASALMNSGFTTALMRKNDRTETDICTVFYYNIAASVLLYLILFFCAGPIADFYNEPRLVAIVRVNGIALILSALMGIQYTLLAIRLDFKTTAKASFSAALISGIVGVTAAYKGLGVWALVIQGFVSQIVSGAIVWYICAWHPRLLYSWRSFRELFGFGYKLCLSSILDTAYGNIYQIVIGKIYSATDLGYYTRAKGFANLPSSNLTGMLSRVAFPVLCSIQDDVPRLQSAYRRLIRMSGFVMFPLMLGLAAVAYPLIHVLLNPNWYAAAPLLQVICFSMMWYPVHALNLNLLQVRGRSDLFLRLEIIKKILGVATLVATAPFGVLVMCYGSVFTSIVCLVINTYYTGKLINVGFWMQMRDLLPTLFYSLTMWLLVLGIVYILPSNWLQLLVGVPVGALYYVGIAYLTRSRDLDEVLLILKKKKQPAE